MLSRFKAGRCHTRTKKRDGLLVRASNATLTNTLRARATMRGINNVGWMAVGALTSELEDLGAKMVLRDVIDPGRLHGVVAPTAVIGLCVGRVEAREREREREREGERGRDKNLADGVSSLRNISSAIIK